MVVFWVCACLVVNNPYRSVGVCGTFLFGLFLVWLSDIESSVVEFVFWWAVPGYTLSDV